MNNTNTIRKSVQVISVIALIVGASGCASQATGGSKLDRKDLVTEIANSENLVKVCTQFGAKMSCRLEDRHVAQDRLDYYRDTSR
jgi:hypothetical protein